MKELKIIMVETLTPLFRHTRNCSENPVSINNFKINSSGFKGNTKSRKIAEAFYIKGDQPSLNHQDVSVPLNLFNKPIMTFVGNQKR